MVLPATFNKYTALLDLLRELDYPLLALSGGLDSSFLAFALKDSGAKASTATIKSILHPESERARAAYISEELGLDASVIDFSDQHLDLIKDNPKDRCYICKKALFSFIIQHGDSIGCGGILDGTTYDDGFTYRPGIKALEELGVRSPIRETGITKSEIRDLCRYFNLEFADLPSFSCFATRFPYGETLTEEKIQRVSKAESFMKRQGFINFRVRSHDTIARVEVDGVGMQMVFDKALMNTMDEALKALGFDYVTLDLGGFKSGSMDIHIDYS